MFCKKCGAQLPEGVNFCNECGSPVQQPQTQQNQAQQDLQQNQQWNAQNAAGYQPQAPANVPTPEPAPYEAPVTPKAKKRWPIVAAIVAAALLVLCGGSALAMYFVPAADVFNLFHDENGERKSIGGKANNKGGDTWAEDIEAIAGFFENLDKSPSMSGANFDAKVSVSGETVGISGYYSLGDDFDDSAAYVKVSAGGETGEVALYDGDLAAYNGGQYGLMTDALDELEREIGLDIRDLIKDGGIDMDALIDFAQQYYDNAGIPIDLRDPMSAVENNEEFKELQKLLEDFSSDNEDAAKKAVKISKTDSSIEYSLDLAGSAELFFEFIEYAAENGTGEFQETAQGILDGMNEEEVDLNEIKEQVADMADEYKLEGPVCTITYDGDTPKTMELEFSMEVEGESVGISVTIERSEKYLESFSIKLDADSQGSVNGSVTLDDGYLDGINLSVDMGGQKMSFDLTLSNQGNPNIDKNKLSEIIDAAVNSNNSGGDDYYDYYGDFGDYDFDDYDYDDYGYDDYDSGDGDYLYPSDTQYITYGDLDGLDRGTVALMRNELYARHGYIFNKDEYKNYFGSKSWYVPMYSDQNTVVSMFSDIERANLNTLMSYEEDKGWK